MSRQFTASAVCCRLMSSVLNRSFAAGNQTELGIRPKDPCCETVFPLQPSQESPYATQYLRPRIIELPMVPSPPTAPEDWAPSRVPPNIDLWRHALLAGPRPQ